MKELLRRAVYLSFAITSAFASPETDVSYSDYFFVIPKTEFSILEETPVEKVTNEFNELFQKWECIKKTTIFPDLTEVSTNVKIEIPQNVIDFYNELQVYVGGLPEIYEQSVIDKLESSISEAVKITNEIEKAYRLTCE